MKRRTVFALMALSLVFSLLAACAASPQKSAESNRGQAPMAPPAGTASGATKDSSAQSGGSQVFPSDRMIIYTANISLVVKDPNQGMDAVTEIVNLAGGVVAGTNVQASAGQKDKDELQTVAMTLRVPATRYQDVMAKLRKLSVKTPEENSTSQDVTEEFSDLGAQLRNLEVVEAQYQELLKKAVTIDDILKVQQKLGETRGQIERIKGRMVYLERRADMATITLYLRPEAAGKDLRPGPWDPFKVASDAWEASMVFLQAIATVAITVAVFFWWMLPVILLAIVLWLVFHSRRRPAVTSGA